MFETTVVESRKQRKRAPYFVSLPLALALHATVAAAWMASGLFDLKFPLAPPPALASYKILQSVAVPPPPPPPPPPARAPVDATPRVELPDDVAPSIVPEFIPDLEAEKPTVIDDAAVEGGVEGGVAGGQIGGIVGGIVGGVIVDAPPPSTIVVPRDATLPVRPIAMEYPMYPEKWRLKQVEDRLVLRYKIDTRGRVSEVRIITPARFPEFNEVSVKTIKRWRFHPLEINGKKKEIVHELTINFKIARPQPRMPKHPQNPEPGKRTRQGPD